MALERQYQTPAIVGSGDIGRVTRGCLAGPPLLDSGATAPTIYKTIT